MKNYKKALSNCLRKIADQIDKMPAPVLEELAIGNFTVRIEVPNKEKPNGREPGILPNDDELKVMESALREMESREEGETYLQLDVQVF